MYRPVFLYVIALFCYQNDSQAHLHLNGACDNQKIWEAASSTEPEQFTC